MRLHVSPHTSMAWIREQKYINSLRKHWRWLIEAVIFSTLLPMSFNTTVLRHVTVTKCNNGCPKIILDAGLVKGALQFPGQHPHRSWNLLIFSFVYFTLKVSPSKVNIREKPRRIIQQFVPEINNKHSECSYTCEFIFFTERWPRCVSLSMKAISTHVLRKGT